MINALSTGYGSEISHLPDMPEVQSSKRMITSSGRELACLDKPSLSTGNDSMSGVVESSRTRVMAEIPPIVIKPKTFEAGYTMESYLLGTMPVAIGLFCSHSFKDLQPGQRANIGVTAARISGDSVDLTALDVQITAEEKGQLEKIMKASRKGVNGLSGMSDNKMIGSLKVSIHPKSLTIETASNGPSKTVCLIIRGKNVIDATDAGCQDLQSEDVVFLLTPGLATSLLNVCQTGVYQGDQDEGTIKATVYYQRDELVNIVLDLVKSSQREGKVLSHNEVCLVKRVYPQVLLYSIADFLKNERVSDDVVTTKGFALYQVP